jgi:hypothetical protein
MQYLTTPEVDDNPGEFSYDESGSHTSPGPGYNQLWTYLRDDTPLPGSPAAAEFGATAATPSVSASEAGKPSTSPSPTVALSSLNVTVINGTDISGEAGHTVTNLKAMGINATLGNNGLSGYTTTTVYYPAGEQLQASTLANQIVGSITKQSTDVNGLTLVIGTNAPSAIVAAPTDSGGSGSGSGSGSGASGAASTSPTATISAQSRNGDENICSNLPGVVDYGGAPSD